MRRTLALALVALLLGAHSARGQVTIIDRLNPGAYAGVTHANALRVEDVGGGGDSVNVFHQSTIRHISSVVHLGGFIGIRDGLCPTCWARVDHAGALSTTASVTTDNVNVFHQSTVRHISSVTHVAGGIMIRDGLCATCTARIDHTGALATTATVTTDNVNVFHQSTIRHISSVTHVGGFIGIRDGLCATCWARVDHAGALSTSASVTTDNVNVFHQSTVRHVSSVSHVQIIGPSYGGTTQAEVKQGAPGSVAPWPVVSHSQQSGAWTIQAAHLAGVPSVSQGSTWAVVSHAQQSGAWTIQAAHLAGTPSVSQGSAWAVTAHQGGNWAIGHVSSVTHVRGLVSIRDDTCLTCKARVDHYNVLVTQPHVSGAFRAWRVADCGTTASLAVSTNLNRRDLIMAVTGNRPVYIGYGATGHVALTQANGFPLHAFGVTSANAIPGEQHAASYLYLPNYNGPIACIAPAASGLAVMEILR